MGSKIASTHSSKPYTVPILTGPTLTTMSDRDYSLYDLSSGILDPVDYIELTSAGLHIHIDPFSSNDTDDENQEAFVEFKTEGFVVFLFA